MRSSTAHLEELDSYFQRSSNFISFGEDLGTDDGKAKTFFSFGEKQRTYVPAQQS